MLSLEIQQTEYPELGLLALWKCTEPRVVDGLSCSPVRDCPGGEEAEICCSTTQCSYRLPTGASIPCDGTDCKRAATRLISTCP